MTMIAPVTPTAAASAASASSTAAAPPAGASRYGFGDDGFTFGDFLDIINPLQHIPVVGTLYRAITGDTMEAGSEIAGGALYGGPIGAAIAVADVAFTESTGKHVDETMLAWAGLDGAPHPVAVATAVPAHPAPSVAGAAIPARAAPVRLFPAATARIVPLAGYTPPAPAAPPQAAPAAQPAPSASAPAPAPAPAAAPQARVEGADALLAALRDSGVDPTSAARAAAAYQAGLALQPPLARPPADDRR